MKKITNYLTALLLLLLLFASNFINTNIFDIQNYNFAVWFILSLFCFACGYFVNKVLGWQWGGKIVFAVVISSVFLSIIMLSMFRDFFAAKALLIDNIILYSLRNITLGAMAFFGMAIAEILHMQRTYTAISEKLQLFETRFTEANKEADLIIKEAKLEAKTIMQNAENSVKNLFLKKERVEKEMKEFIEAEKELLKRYEEKAD